MKKSVFTKLCFLIALFYFSAMTTYAQINPLDKVKDKTTNRVDNKVDNGIDKGLDKVEGVFKKKDKSDKTKDGDTEETKEEAESDTKTTTTTDTKAKDNPEFKSYSKYDFIPGSEILFYEDFSQDAVGDFPALWTTDGTGEVQTTNTFPGKWLYFSGTDNTFCLMKDLVLPENFIIEFDIVPTSPLDDLDALSFNFAMYKSTEDWLDNTSYPGTAGFKFHANFYNMWLKGYAPDKEFIASENNTGIMKNKELTHVIFWIQKRRVRIYSGGQKLIDGPTALPENASYNRLRFSMWDCQGKHFISNIKITTAAPDMRSKLLTEGKLVSYGCYFDSGSSTLKAESYGTIKEIAAVLTENPTVKIKIVGFTDSDGDDATNLELSKKRAIAVKEALNKDFAIDNSRLETDGKGETEAIAPNTTAEGKAKNRRVEFIKL